MSKIFISWWKQLKERLEKKKAELEKASETERDQYWGFNYLYRKLQLKLREHWQ